MALLLRRLANLWRGQSEELQYRTGNANLRDLLLDALLHPTKVVAVVSSPFFRLGLRLNGVRLKGTAAVYGCPKIENRGEILVGDGVRLVSSNRAYVAGNLTGPVFLRTEPGARIVLKDKAQLNGTTVVSAVSVTIGERVMVGTDTIIFDTDLHSIAPEGRTRHRDKVKHKAVEISDDVWIGSRCIILKGVTIGRGSVIGAGSVVVSDVPSMTVFAGNPAKMVKSIDE